MFVLLMQEDLLWRRVNAYIPNIMFFDLLRQESGNQEILLMKST